MNSRRRVVFSIVLVALVALAGCTSGPFGDPAGADSATPSSLDDLSFPDGASDEAVENGSALATTHAELLSDRGYAVALTASYSSAAESGSSTYVVRRDAETGELYQRTVQNSDGDELRDFAYANDSATYEKRGADDPSYSVDTTTTSDEQAANNVVRAPETLVPVGDWTDPSVVSTGGQAFIEYDLDGVSADAGFVDSEAVTNASGSLLVDQQGVVHRVTLDLALERDGTTSEVSYEYRVITLGDVTVEKPDWVSTAAEQDDPAQISNRVTVVASTGNVVGGRVENVTLIVMRAAGAGDIDLSKATIEWIDPETATTLAAGDSATRDTFAVEAVKDGDDSTPVLNGQGDRAKITMDASEIGSGLQPGDTVNIAITTQSGATTSYYATVPEDLSGNSVVSL